jgi:hypothetical protein
MSRRGRELAVVGLCGFEAFNAAAQNTSPR